MKFDEAGYIMSCSTPGEDKWTETGGPSQDGGLVPGHAYTLLSAKMTRYGDKLVLIRNPWGSFEWGGDWSDNSPKWTKEAISDVGAHLVEGDGTFWMGYEDFLAHFNGINVCRVKGHIPGSTPWCETRTKGFYTFDPATGNVMTPMYILDVQEETDLYLAVHQKDERIVGAPKYLDIGVTLLKLAADNTYSLESSSGNSVSRENQVEVIVSPGRYVAIPTTTGCKFALNALHGDPADPVSVSDADGKLNKETEAALRYVYIFIMFGCFTRWGMAPPPLIFFVIANDRQ